MNDEIELIYTVIVHPCGFDVGMEGLLTVRRYDHPMWAVEWQDPKDLFKRNMVKEFEDPRRAAEFFVKKRYQLSLGLDLIK